MSKLKVPNFAHMLLAVLAGNAAYFVLMPYLPPAARHIPYRLDFGLLVDFLFCVAVLAIVKKVARWGTAGRRGDDTT